MDSKSNDFFVVYSDTPFDLKANTYKEDIFEETLPYSMSSQGSRPSSSTFGERKRNSPSRAGTISPISKVDIGLLSPRSPVSKTSFSAINPLSPTHRKSDVPLPPRRLSSKWHPSLIKSLKLHHLTIPPPEAPRSTSAERVKETRALYSLWHREMVAKSREKLTNPPSRFPAWDIDKLLREANIAKNFLLDRRAVSESRFTLQDRKIKETYQNAGPRSLSAEGRIVEGDSKKLGYKSMENKSKYGGNIITKTKSFSGKERPPLSTKRVYHSLERPSKSLSSNIRSSVISPTRHNDDASKLFNAYNKSNVIRHTVSSMNKIKNLGSVQKGNKTTRSHSADERKSSRHSACFAANYVELSSRKKYFCKKDWQSKNISKQIADSKKRLEQSESFDTTHSNETGYSSMLDISSSFSDSKSQLTTRKKEIKTQPVMETSKGCERESISLPVTLNRRYESRPHSAPGLRTKSSAFFNERLEKWQLISMGESVGKGRSTSSSRSTSPLRSLELVKRVSSSFRNNKKKSTFDMSRLVKSKSLENLSPSPHTHPRRYREYILELKNAVPKSARICQLRRLFDSLEKVHNLERSVSTIELSAFDNKSSGIVDFETWKNLKDKQRKAIEYKILLKQLDAAQKEKDFFYKAKDAKKWTGDCRLIGREHYVKQLRERFDSFEEEPYSPTKIRRRDIEYEKDTYRGLWRGSSVKDLTKNITDIDRKRCKRGSSLSLTREDSRLRPKGLWTSLSLEQINALREQLNEIYGSMQSIRSWREKREINKLIEAKRNKVHENSEKSDISQKKFMEAGRAISNTIKNMQQGPLSLNNDDKPIEHNHSENRRSRAVDKTEEQRKKLSKQLSIELQEKVAEQKNYKDKFYVSERPSSVSPETLSRSSPRTCYSLDVSDSSEPSSLTSNVGGDQLLLVVKKPRRSNSLPNERTSDGDSSDSDISVRTVIQKDVAGKVKYFEKKSRKNTKSSSKGSFLNIDPTEVQHYATLPFCHKSYDQNYLYRSSYVPEHSLSSLNLDNKYMNLKYFPKERESWQAYSENKLTPNIDTSYSRSYLLHVKSGDVQKLKDKYEGPEDRRLRSKSLSDIRDTLSRVTPTDRTVIRGQEIGNVEYTRKKYEIPRQSIITEHWKPLKDEYLPKSKIVSTLSTLATRSPSFNEPNTVDRISRRESVEKAALRRMHKGVVETVVGKFESKINQSDVSIMGQMYTSAPSLRELIHLSPLIPPCRPPLPATPPRKPLRSSSFSPCRLSKLSSHMHPLKTSTPTISPEYERGRSLSPSYSLKFNDSPKPCLFETSTPYDASAHVPKSRYTPLDSYGATKWTQSLERPRRLAKALAFSREIERRRAQSFSPPPRGQFTYRYGPSRSMSPPPQYGYSSMDSDYSLKRNRFIHSRPLSPPPHYFSSGSNLRSHMFSPQNNFSLGSGYTYPSGSRVHTPTTYYGSLGQRQFREPRSTTRFSSLHQGYPLLYDYRYEPTYSLPYDYSTHSNYNTYPLNRNRIHASSTLQKGYRSDRSSEFTPGTVSSRPSSSLSKEGSKSVTFKEPFVGSLPRHYGDFEFEDTPYKYRDSEVNIHYKTPVRVEQKQRLSDEELARRQEEHMKKVYEQERRKKYLSELEDIERRRHTDYFTPLQKSPIPLNRYDDEPFGGVRGAKTPEPRQIAKALFGFSAQNKRELSFSKGDVISIRRLIDRNWYEGELRGCVGIFPCNYVEIIPFDSLKTIGRKLTEGQARARFNFKAQTAMEMSLTKGELVLLTRRVDDNWYEGRVSNRKGIFPVTYVETLIEPSGSDRPITPSLDPIPRPALPANHLLYNGTASGVSSPLSTMGRPGSQNENQSPFAQLTVNTHQEPIPYRALYNYKPQNEDELELLEGDVVLVMEKCDDGWFVGTSKRTSLFGTFPGNYVERV